MQKPHKLKTAKQALNRSSKRSHKHLLTLLAFAVQLAIVNPTMAKSLDGTGQNGILNIPGDSYDSIVGFRVSDPTVDRKAELTFLDSTEVSGDVIGLLIESPFEDVNAGYSFITIKGPSLRGGGNLYTASTETYKTFSSLSFNNHRLQIVNTTVDIGRQYVAAVGLDTSVQVQSSVSAKNNFVEVSGSQMNFDLLSAVDAKSASGLSTDWENNQIFIKDSKVNGNVITVSGGRSQTNGTIAGINNTVLIENSHLTGYVRAFDTTTATYSYLEAIDNKVEIRGSTVENPYNIIAVSSQNSAEKATSIFKSNVVNLVDAAVNGLYAVSAQTMYSSPKENDYELINNSIYAENSELKGATYVASCSISSSAPQNKGTIQIKDSTLVLNGSTFTGQFLRASYAATRAGDNHISGTQIVLTDSSVSPTNNFYADMSFATEGGNSIVEGTQIVSDSSMLKGVFSAVGTSVSQGLSTVKDVSFILKGTSILEGDFCLADVTSASAEVKNNQFWVQDQVDLSQAKLQAYTISTNFEAEIQNNDIVFSDWRGAENKQIKGLTNFDHIVFDAIHWQDQGTAIQLMSGKDSLSSTKVISGTQEWMLVSDQAPKVGESMTLIDGSVVLDTEQSTIGLSNDNFAPQDVFYVRDQIGVEGDADFYLDDQGSLHMSIAGYKATSQAIQLAENRAAASAFLSHGNDLVVDALDVMATNPEPTQGLAIIQGEAARYDTQSRIKVNGMHALLGTGIKVSPDWHWTGFFETGRANYRTDNVFMGEAFRGDGDLSYWGAGLASRYYLGNGFHGHIGLQAGALHSDMEHALRNSEGKFYDVSDHNVYWSAQLGVGWRKTFGPIEWDFSTRYMHTRVDSGSERVGTELFAFEAVESHRWRTVLKNRVSLTDKFDIGVGVGWDYEADGDALMRVGNVETPVQSLEGHTGFGELNCLWKHKTFNLEARVRGYSGVINGWEGQVRGVLAF